MFSWWKEIEYLQMGLGQIKDQNLEGMQKNENIPTWAKMCESPMGIFKILKLNFHF
jgi:hypothetical protein